VGKDVEKIQKSFIKTLVDLQCKTLETVSHRQNQPMFPGVSNVPVPARARVRKKKVSKKQLVALKKGRQVLAAKNRQVAKEVISI